MSAVCKPLWLLLVSVAASLSGCALTSSGSAPVVTKPVVTPAPQSTPASVADKTSAVLMAPATSIPPATNEPVADAQKTPVSPAVQKQFERAVELLKSSRLTEAQQQLLSLTVSNPELSAPWINLGVMEFKASHFDAAIKHFRQALERDAQSPIANNYLGMSYRSQGQFREAEAAYQAAISANNEYALAHFNLGVLYDLYLQKPEQALEQYESYQALQGTPDPRVASWIKELKGRLSSKAKAAEKQS